MRRVVRLLTPPLLFNAVKSVTRRRPPEDELFSGYDEAFKETAVRSRVYGEYGCGASTRWMATNTKASIYAVDTSEQWISTVSGAVGSRERISLRWVDVGPLGNWGRPAGFSKSNNFSTYTDWIWNQKEKPDLVLIDGRFRVCCFATSLKNAAEDSTIIFDDYIDRTDYHIVEDLIKPIRTCGRQAVFKVPSKDNIDMAVVGKMISDFRFVIN